MHSTAAIHFMFGAPLGGINGIGAGHTWLSSRFGPSLTFGGWRVAQTQVRKTNLGAPRVGVTRGSSLSLLLLLGES